MKNLVALINKGLAVLLSVYQHSGVLCDMAGVIPLYPQLPEYHY